MNQLHIATYSVTKYKSMYLTVVLYINLQLIVSKTYYIK